MLEETHDDHGDNEKMNYIRMNGRVEPANVNYIKAIFSIETTQRKKVKLNF